VPRYGAFLCLAALLAGLQGCSVNPPLDLSVSLPRDSSLRLTGIPFFPQQEYQCGPAALAGLLGAAGVAADPASLSPQVYLPGRQGSLQLEMQGATRRAGRIPYLTQAQPAALFAELEAGRPVLVFQNLQTPRWPVWHYALLVGFDTRANTLTLNSGAEEGLAVPAPEFLRTWDWAGRWAMVALRPGELPARVESGAYLAAVAAFEAVAGNQAAAPAWQAAEQRWPQDPRAYLAQGNAAYAQGRLPQAVSFYRRGLARQPMDPALGNNLASVLGEMGCPHAAADLLAPVLAGLPADSNWRPVLAATLAELTPEPAADQPGCAGLAAP